jgi:hypothetical protein
MAAQTQVIIPLDQHFFIDGAVRVVARGASLPQGFVFKNLGSRLFLVALSANRAASTHQGAGG